jgi:hypothetical protein
MKNTSLMCLSSPEGDANYYSQLMNLKRKGTTESFFTLVECYQICMSCQKKERADAIKCTHVKSTAHWLSSRKIKELMQLYAASPEDAIREFGGVVVSDYLPALPRQHVEHAIREQPRITTHIPPKFVFTCCDPAGDGPSFIAIVSGYFTQTGEIVVSFLNCVVYGDRPHWPKP